jgi:hypothetical protein
LPIAIATQHNEYRLRGYSSTFYTGWIQYPTVMVKLSRFTFLPSPAILKTPTTVTSLCGHFTACRALSVRGLRPWENSSRVKTDNEFFKDKSAFLTDSRVTFVHKCNQDSSVPEPLRQEYIIHYQRICTESVVNEAPVHILRWETYKVVLQTMNHKCRKSPGVPDHFTTANDLLNWIQGGNRLSFVKPPWFWCVKQGHTLLNCTGPTSNSLPTEARDVVLTARAARDTHNDNRQTRRLVSDANSPSVRWEEPDY